MVDGHEMVTDPQTWDYQYGKTLDVWSHALWLGAALEALVAQAEAGNEDARLWVSRVPHQVKATWPGIFPEYPYQGEPPDEHAARQARGG